MPELAVLGDPVSHSLSPRIFQFLFERRGVPSARYVAERVTAHQAELSAAVARVRTGALFGASVTLPHKQAVLALSDTVSPEAKACGAANCLLHKDGKVEAFNTDVKGLHDALFRHGVRLGGKRVLILGAGGAARAAAYLAAKEGAATIAVANRTVDKARALLSSLSLGWGRALPLDGQGLEEAEVVLQATSVGLSEAGASPLPPGARFRRGQVVLDMVYRPLWTETLLRARQDGARTVDGLWMLLFQALEQFRLFGLGDVTADAATVDALRAHLEAA